MPTYSVSLTVTRPAPLSDEALIRLFREAAERAICVPVEVTPRGLVFEAEPASLEMLGIPMIGDRSPSDPRGRNAGELAAVVTQEVAERRFNRWEMSTEGIVRAWATLVSTSTPRPLDGLTILIVDNHQDTVNMFVEYLRGLGAAVVGSNTARRGLHISLTVRRSSLDSR